MLKKQVVEQSSQLTSANWKKALMAAEAATVVVVATMAMAMARMVVLVHTTMLLQL